MSMVKGAVFVGVLVLLSAIAIYFVVSKSDYSASDVDLLAMGQSAYEDQRFEDAANWYLQAARKGQTAAQYQLAMMYRQGKGVDRDDEQVVRWLKLAARLGHHDAQYQLGKQYEVGRGVDHPDDIAAAELYRKAAESGNAKAQYRLSVLYSEGRGVSQNDHESLRWAVKAVKGGDPDARAVMQQIVNRSKAKGRQGDETDKSDMGRCD